MFYIQGQNLCEVVNDSKNTQAVKDTNKGLCKWKIKNKLKSACCGISKLEPEATIGEMRIKKNNVPWLKTRVSKFYCCNKRMAYSTIII